MKSEIRKEFLNKLSSLDNAEKQRLSNAIQINLNNLLKDESGTWAGYQSLNEEPQLNWSEVSEKVNWSFPKTNNDTLEFSLNADKFSKSALGVLEPQNGETIKLAHLNGLVIPAVAYDSRGVRLGRGKGYYDRSLKTYGGKKIGVCFDISFCEQLPQEEHDIKCHYVVTDKRILKIN